MKIEVTVTKQFVPFINFLYKGFREGGYVGSLVHTPSALIIVYMDGHAGQYEHQEVSDIELSIRAYPA